MKRSIFIVLCCISTVLSVGALLLLMSDRLYGYPDQYRLAVILAIPVFALIAIICYIIQSVLKDKEWKKFQAEHPEQAQTVREQLYAQAQNAVGDFDLYQLSILRGKIGSIFGRILAAVLISSFSGDVLIWYIWVSYGWFFIKRTRNYIIGIVACFLSFLYFAEKISGLPAPWNDIMTFVLIGGAFIIDLINVIRYIALKHKITKAGMTIRKLSKEEKMAFRNAK